jgi:signal transduction histidine kinase
MSASASREPAGRPRHSSRQQLIKHILDLSKIEAGRYELFTEDIAVAAVVEECMSVISVTARQRDVKLTFTTDHLLSVSADNRALKQILLNLLSNAVKFTPPGGRVSLNAMSDSHRMIAFVVTDTGIGIAADDLDRIFEPFRRADASVSRAYEGDGAGRRTRNLRGDRPSGCTGGRARRSQIRQFAVRLRDGI